VDAILAGQRDGAELTKLRHQNIKADTETVRKSLEGNWRPEHLCLLPSINRESCTESISNRS